MAAADVSTIVFQILSLTNQARSFPRECPHWHYGASLRKVTTKLRMGCSGARAGIPVILSQHSVAEAHSIRHVDNGAVPTVICESVFLITG